MGAGSLYKTKRARFPVSSLYCKESMSMQFYAKNVPTRSKFPKQRVKKIYAKLKNHNKRT